MKYKLWIADVDGTLRGGIRKMVDHTEMFLRVNPGEKTIQAMKQMHAEGVILIVASGRPLWQEVCDHYKQWGLGFQFDACVGTNGGEIYDNSTGKTTVYNPLSPDSLKKIALNVDDHFHINPFVYRNGYEETVILDDFMRIAAKKHGTKVAATGDLATMYSQPTGKILYRCPDAETAQKLLDYGKSIADGSFDCFRTGPDLVEFQSPLVTKGSALVAYCEAHGIDLQDTIAFGDAENDIDLFRKAGYSVCLQDGMELAKQAADDITDYPVIEDGVGRYLYDHGLLKQ